MTTQGKTGFTGSETSACSGKLSSGSRTPAVSMTTEVFPAADTATFFARMKPLAVSTPKTRPEASRRIAVTGQFWMMSRSEEHTSELQSLMRISYAVFCLNKKTNTTSNDTDKTLNQYTSTKKLIKTE